MRALPSARGIAVALVTLLVSCAGTTRAVVDPASISMAGVPVEYVPMFEALGQAVRARENVSAQAILNNLRGRLGREAQVMDALPLARRESVERALQLADAYGSVLAGRERVDSLRLVLELRELEGSESRPGRRMLTLAASSGWDRPLELTTGPAALLVHTTAVDAVGGESSRSSSLALDLPTELQLRPGEEVELALGEVPLTCSPRAIAVRYEWDLRLTAAFVSEEGIGYPAMRIRVEPCEATVLDGAMPRGVVGVEDLLRFVTDEVVKLPPAPDDERRVGLFREEQREYTLRLLALALRVPPEQRLAALRSLAQLVETQPVDFVCWIVPALRWLSREGEPGRDPSYWRRWLLERQWEEPDPRAGSGGSTLEMPRARLRNGALDSGR